MADLAQWYQESNKLPYTEYFPTLSYINYYPLNIWTSRQRADDTSPTLVTFPEPIELTGGPNDAWRMGAEELPFKKSFPALYHFTDAPYNIWIIKDGIDIPYMNNFPPMLGPPKMWGSPTKILLKEMHTSPILLKTQKSQDVQIGDTTIPHQITKRLFDGIDWELI